MPCTSVKDAYRTYFMLPIPLDMVPSTTCLSVARIPNSSMRCLRTALGVWRGLGANSRYQCTPGQQAFISARPFATSPPLAARHSETVFSEIGGNHYVKRTPSASVLVATTSVAVGILLYISSQRPLRMDRAGGIVDGEIKPGDPGQAKTQVSLMMVNPTSLRPQLTTGPA